MYLSTLLELLLTVTTVPNSKHCLCSKDRVVQEEIKPTFCFGDF